MQAWFGYGSGGHCIVCHSDEVDQQDVHHVYTASKVTQAQLLRADRQSFLRLAEMVTNAFKPNAAGACCLCLKRRKPPKATRRRKIVIPLILRGTRARARKVEKERW